ncbi:GDP-mannose-dependent alpha-(1-2)-phosphatidylinositol mannosyltransferase [Aquisphaera giovannonii]|uniref:GDP-mannose-dependent alpha-(1-2)-phosphatidylinositol mannosyltransferase n=1 Tax=Aquisphaera giovannonii TaxID=406548 RepID=A0A5B9W9M3_9BACT|nr:glycosyltransferase [Aquisphaera giovannonii]QEH36939.1 GDP-mannose-dependent alpha-(1-2)-phosphatidylinositol mannosyltransferase [Aquisphaera giovannonii]
MRILLTAHRFPPDAIAGVERYTQSLASELTSRGDCVHVVTRRPAMEPNSPGVEVERIAGGPTVHRFVGGGGGDQDAPEVRRKLESLFEGVLAWSEPEVVHINHLGDLSPRFAEIARCRGAEVVLSLHDFFLVCAHAHLRRPTGELCDGPRRGKECHRTCFASTAPSGLARWEKRCDDYRSVLGQAGRIICPSRFIASYFEAYGVPSERLQVIPNGVSIPPDEAPELASQPRQGGPVLQLVFLGTVVAHKGVHMILEALSRAALGAVRLWAIGATPDPEYTRLLRKRAERIAGLEFRLYGPYDPRILPLLLRDADCAIVPSLVAESFSITTREALVRSVPVLASRLGALPEAIQDGENGFTFNPDQPEELASLLRRIATEPGLLRRLRGGARASRTLTTAQHADLVRSVYEDVLSRSSRGTICVRTEPGITGGVPGPVAQPGWLNVLRTRHGGRRWKPKSAR